MLRIKNLLLICFIGVCSISYAGISLDAGTVYVDNSINTKYVCYLESSGKITHSGSSPDDGRCAFVQGGWTRTKDDWQISYDGTNYSNFTMPETGIIPELTKSIWIRKHIKITGTYYTCLASGFGFTKEGHTNSINIIVYPDNNPGSISGSQTICYNSLPTSINSTANASGGKGTFSFTWEKSNNSTTWEIVSGASSSAYASPALTQTTYFRRIATNTCGSKNTDYVTISVQEQLKAGTVSNSQTICNGSTPVPFSATSPSGAMNTYTYQWEKSNNNVTWNSIPSATSAGYSSPVLTSSTYFRRKVTSGSCGSEYTNSITVSVNGKISAGTISGNQTIFYNTTPATLSNTSSATGGTGTYAYQWQSSLNNSTFTNLPGASNLSYSPGILTQTTYFRRVVKSGECGSSYSNVITVSVYGDINAGVIGNEQYICYNTTPSPLIGDQASGGNGTYTYQWQVSLDGTIWNNAVNGSGQNYTTGSLTKTTFYRRSVKSPPDTRIKYSNEIMILVYPQISPGVIGSNQTICYNARPITLMGSDPAGGIGQYMYQWYKSLDNVNFEPILLANSDIYSPEALTENAYYKREVSSGECGSVSSNIILVTVLKPIIAGVIGNSQTICYNATPTSLSGEMPTGGAGSYSYKWQQSTNGNEFLDIPLATSQSYSAIALTQPTYFRRAVTSGTCGTFYSEPVLIDVYPQLLSGTITGDQSICFDTLPSVFSGELPTGGTGSYSYKWQKSLNGLSWQDIFLSEDYFYQEKARLRESAFYKRIVTSGDCGSEQSNIIKVHVFDKMESPQVDIKEAYCKGSNIELEVKKPINEYDYIWNISNNENTLSELTVFDLQNSLNFDVRAVYKQMCESPRSFYSLNLDEIKANFNSDASLITEGEGLQFKNASQNASSYYWDFNGEGISVRENPWHYFYGPGLKTISLIAKSSNGCSDTLTKANYILVQSADSSYTQLKGIMNNGRISIYPNPVINELNIELDELPSGILYELISQSGAIIFRKSADGNKNELIDMSLLAQGIYILRIYIDNQILTEKIIKQ